MSVSPRMALWREPPPCWICGLQLTALVLPFALILMVYVPMGWRLLLRPTNLREMGHWTSYWIIHQWATKWVSDAAGAFLAMLAASCRDDSVGRQLNAKTDIHGPWSLTCTGFGDPNCLNISNDSAIKCRSPGQKSAIIYSSTCRWKVRCIWSFTAELHCSVPLKTWSGWGRVLKSGKQTKVCYQHLSNKFLSMWPL